MNDATQGAQALYYNSLIEGYVELNLILSDPEVFASMMTSKSQRMSDAICGMLVSGDRPTQWLEEHIRPALHGYHLKPVAEEVL